MLGHEMQLRRSEVRVVTVTAVSKYVAPRRFLHKLRAFLPRFSFAHISLVSRQNLIILGAFDSQDQSPDAGVLGSMDYWLYLFRVLGGAFEGCRATARERAGLCV